MILISCILRCLRYLVEIGFMSCFQWEGLCVTAEEYETYTPAIFLKAHTIVCEPLDFIAKHELK